MHATKLLLIIGLLAGMNACTIRETQQDTPPDQASPVAAPRVKKTSTPDALVQELYRQHDAGNGPFFQTDDRPLLGRYFERELADLIWADMTTTEAGESMLDADPLYNAQDIDIKKFSVHPAAERDGATEVRVTFENFGEQQEIRCRMIQLRGKWRIADIIYPDGSQLYQLLSGPDEETP
ncbi:hypothetical protein GGR92_000047 [Spirosoma lacussanchae]|uniref:DUF3828 domain-containing protein n=1 Tax=Spirosoma lacussanchae TaxID=1884249 RepID=UPI001109DC12|nr:DUF3828 domain-containing protein [Spirosoma lacussanchae]